MRRKHYVFMDVATETPAGGAPAPTPAPAPAPAPTPTPAPVPAPASLLQAGSTAPAATPTDFIPEKYRTNKEDGTFDLEASSKKLAEAYGNAEKRIGSGDIPPKEASEYKVAVPDALKEAIDSATDPGVQGFLSGALEAGLTQKQVDFVMGKYFELAPQLAAGAVQFDANTATAELKKTWATDADFNRNVRNAFVGTNAIAAKAGMTTDDILNGPLGNNPQFLRLMAAIGPEFSEDSPPGGSQMATQEDINTLLSSEAYSNPKHSDHAKTSEKIRKYFERKHGTDIAG